MKKTLCLFLLLCLALSLCACGGSAAPASTPVTQSAVAEAPAGEETATEETAPTADTLSANSEGLYRVYVSDPEGRPIPDVSVQLCSDLACMVAVSDENGLAVFQVEEDSYTVHILKVPAGYAGSDEEFTLLEGYCDLHVTLDRADENSPSAEPAMFDGSDYGFIYQYPEKYRNMDGLLRWTSQAGSPGSFTLTLEYVVPSEESLAALTALEERLDGRLPTPEELYEADVTFSTLFMIFADHVSADEASQLEAGLERGLDGLEYLGNAAVGHGWSGFVLRPEADELSPGLAIYMGDSYEEYLALMEDAETFFSGFVPLADQPREAVRFETVDLAGQPVSSEDLFAGHTVTMVNLWATWCGPCKNELADLEKLSKEFEAQGCQIIGLCLDAPEGMVDEAVKILADRGVTYPNLFAPDDVDFLFPATVIPTSYFVDSEGNILLDPVEGAAIQLYTASLEQALEMLG